MPNARALKWPAVSCVLLLGFCSLLTYPFAEIGSNDDFAYVRSAKALAETGHVVYFGWASAMLGWQLALGALFIKLFGFSFTAARSSILLVALLTAWLLQRTFVRLGLGESNATLATLTVVLSPLFIPLSLSFMSDIPGLLAIVLSLYLCLRAIQTQVPARTTAYLTAAALASALLGTARQTGWLGVLVIFPSACWILRRRKLPILLLASVWILCVGFIFGCLRWFAHQMYATTESTNGMGTDSEHLMGVVHAGVRVPLQIAFFLSPILIAFAVPFFQRKRRLAYLAMLALVALFGYFVLQPHSYWISVVVAPATSGGGNYVTYHGILDVPGIGSRPRIVGPGIRTLISVVCYFSALGWLLLMLTSKQADSGSTSSERTPPLLLSWRQMLVLIVPFLLAYCAFLSLRILSGIIFDRYMLPLLMVIAPIAARFYQDRVSARLPKSCYAVLLLVAAFATAGTHDMFAGDRARLAAIQQLLSAGVPRTAFYGGFAYDGWTQIDQQGYVDVDDIHTATGIRHLSDERARYKPCGYWFAQFYPSIRPQYAISYDELDCDPQDRFAPIPYRLWLPPFHGSLYTRKVSREWLDGPPE